MRKSFTTRLLVLSALLAAMSIVLSRFCVIWITPSVRVSFGNIPVMLAGIMYGPLAGALVGAVADTVGAAALSGYGWYPPLTVGPALIGIISALLRKPVRKKPTYPVVLLSVLSANVISSMAYMTWVLSGYNGVPFEALIAVRTPLYAGISLVEAAVLALVLRSPVMKYAASVRGGGI